MPVSRALDRQTALIYNDIGRQGYAQLPRLYKQYTVLVYMQQTAGSLRFMRDVLVDSAIVDIQ